METTWGIAAVWLGLAARGQPAIDPLRMSVALIEILVGIAAGNLAMLLNHYQIPGGIWLSSLELGAEAQ